MNTNEHLWNCITNKPSSHKPRNIIINIIHSYFYILKAYFKKLMTTIILFTIHRDKRGIILLYNTILPYFTVSLRYNN